MKQMKFYNPLSLTNDEEAIKYKDEINEALKTFDDDLAPYADDYEGDSYYKKLHSCRIRTEEVNGVLYGLAVCEVADDWNETDTEQMKEYLSGQYSDGWGECFEQAEILEYEEEYTEIHEDEDGKEYEETYTEAVGLYCSYWNGRDDWFIKTAEEMGIKE